MRGVSQCRCLSARPQAVGGRLIVANGNDCSSFSRKALNVADRQRKAVKGNPGGGEEGRGEEGQSAISNGFLIKEEAQ